MEFCYQSWNFTNFAPEFYHILYVFFATTKDLSIDVEIFHFLMLSEKCCECKIKKIDGHRKLRNGHGKICCQVCGNPVIRGHVFHV